MDYLIYKMQLKHCDNQQNSNQLEHTGVKGMKWGVRKALITGGAALGTAAIIGAKYAGQRSKDKLTGQPIVGFKSNIASNDPRTKYKSIGKAALITTLVACAALKIATRKEIKFNKSTAKYNSR